MKKLLVALLVVGSSVNAYSNPIVELSSGFANMIAENILKSSKSHDAVKRNHLESIKKGIIDLEKMNDPNIGQVYKLTNSLLRDNHLSLQDYNSITKLINEHKRKLNANNSKHGADVADFKRSLNPSKWLSKCGRKDN